MPGSLTALDSTGVIGETVERVEDRERALAPTERPNLRETGIFSTPEDPTVSESGCYEPDTGGAVVACVARCRVAGTTASTVTVKHNGTLIATITIAAGALRGVAYVTPVRRIAANVDYLTAAVTAVGSGVKAITVFVRLRT